MTITTKTPRPGKAIRGNSGQYFYRPLGIDRVYEIQEMSRWDIGTKTHWNVRLVGDTDWFDSGNTLSEAKNVAYNDASAWEKANRVIETDIGRGITEHKKAGSPGDSPKYNKGNSWAWRCYKGWAVAELEDQGDARRYVNHRYYQDTELRKALDDLASKPVPLWF